MAIYVLRTIASNQARPARGSDVAFTCHTIKCEIACAIIPIVNARSSIEFVHIVHQLLAAIIGISPGLLESCPSKSIRWQGFILKVSPTNFYTRRTSFASAFEANSNILG